MFHTFNTCSWGDMDLNRRACHVPESIVSISHALKNLPLRSQIADIGVTARINIPIRADINGINDRDIKCYQIKNI